MRVEVAACLGVNETNGLAIAWESEFLVRFVIGLSAVGVEEPIVVGILVVVTCDLLLRRTLGIGLVMRVEQPTTITHVLQSCAGSICNLKGAILANFRASKVGLEQRAHLRISRSTVLQNEEVQVEREHVHCNGNYDESENPEAQMCCQFDLLSSVAYQLKHCVSLTFGILRSPNLFQRSSMVYSPTRAVQKKPTHLTLQTHPIDTPVIISQKPHSGENGSFCRRWNLAQQRTVVNVKHRSIESSRMNLEIVVYEFSNRTMRVTSQTVGLRKFSSLAV